MWSKLIHRLKKLKGQRAIILMYHQVCQRKSDPWDLAVDPDRFETHLNFLKRKFAVLPMDEMASMVESGNLKQNSIAITFDDGFYDNYLNAMPLLEWYQLPATFYFTTNRLAHARPYWWDELESIILHSNSLPDFLFININNQPFSFQLKRHKRLDGKTVQEIATWRFGGAFNSERIDLYLKLWKRIQPLHHAEQDKIIRELKSWAAYRHSAWPNALMNEYQLKKLSNSSLFDVGAHTVHHSMLGACSSDEQFYEIAESKKDLERLLQKDISGFAYPYGNYTDVTRKLVAQAGYQYAVSTEASAVESGADVFALPRVQVKNWSVTELAFNLKQLANGNDL